MRVNMKTLMAVILLCFMVVILVTAYKLLTIKTDITTDNNATESLKYYYQQQIINTGNIIYETLGIYHTDDDDDDQQKHHTTTTTGRKYSKSNHKESGGNSLTLNPFEIRDVTDVPWKHCDPNDENEEDPLIRVGEGYRDLFVNLLHNATLSETMRLESVVCGTDFKGLDICSCMTKKHPQKIFHQVWLEEMDPDVFNLSKATSRYCPQSHHQHDDNEQNPFFKVYYSSSVVVRYAVENVKHIIWDNRRGNSKNRSPNTPGKIEYYEMYIQDRQMIQMFTDMYEKCIGAMICDRRLDKSPHYSSPSTSGQTVATALIE